MHKQHLLLLAVISSLFVGEIAFGQTGLDIPPIGPEVDILKGIPPQAEPPQVPAPDTVPIIGDAPKVVVPPMVQEPKKGDIPAPKEVPQEKEPAAPSVIKPGPQDNVVVMPLNSYAHGCKTCGHGCNTPNCNYKWFIHWTCDDLKMEPVERKRHCGHCGWWSWLYCPEPCECEEEEGDDTTYVYNSKGNLVETGSDADDSKEGATQYTIGDNGVLEEAEEEDPTYVYNTKGELVESGSDADDSADDAPEYTIGENGQLALADADEEEEEEDDLNPLMGFYRCHLPGLYDCMDNCGIYAYGFMQGGFTGNIDSPRDRLNFGVNNNNRSNDFLLNQLYFAVGRDLVLDCTWNWGFRMDILAGADAFENASLERGFLDHAWSEGTFSYGVDVPQFYVDFHMPILTKRGVDVRVGHMYTHMGFEVWPGTDTDFYSHSYESFYGIPFTNTGVDTIVHIGDTLDWHNGLYVGWDNVFEDNNRAWSWMGKLAWNSCDERTSVTLAYMFGPEQDNNNQDYRTLITLNMSHTFGRCNQWRWDLAGIVGFDPNASDAGQDTQWYGALTNLFYTINPKCRLGMRAEWFADPQGFRTGFATDYYDVTLGLTYKPLQNVRIRPEVRVDWAGYQGVTPYNDQTDSVQTTLGFDIIWDF